MRDISSHKWQRSQNRMKNINNNTDSHRSFSFRFVHLLLLFCIITIMLVDAPHERCVGSIPAKASANAPCIRKAAKIYGRTK